MRTSEKIKFNLYFPKTQGGNCEAGLKRKTFVSLFNIQIEICDEKICLSLSFIIYLLYF